MSYDLVAFPREGKTLPTFEEFQNFFKQRKHYVFEENMACYENPESETYFIWAYETEAPDFEALGIVLEGFDQTPSEDDLPYPLICFNIGYGYTKPHLEETAEELTAFYRHFDLLVDDPQVDGMGRAEFTAEGFLKSYVSGNIIVRGFDPLTV